MVSMVRDRAISPVELVEAHLVQIAARNPALNAFVSIFADAALEEARVREHEVLRGDPLGMLHGVPVTVKDSFDVCGSPTQSGSRLRPPQPAAADAAAVAALRREGAVLLGKTNTPELLASYETDNFLTGRTNNPWDDLRTPGGSSGGEAAAIAACCSPGGLATDGGGSIRVPAHFCGIAGLKPTPGRISVTGHFPAFSHPAGLMTAAGPMARTAEDLRLLFAALVGYDPQDSFSVPVSLDTPALSGVHIGVWPQFYGVALDPEIRAAVERAAALLEQVGFGTGEFAPRGLERAPNVWAFLFNQWPSSETRKLIEGRESEAHWTLLESLGTKEATADQALLNLAARARMRASLLRQMARVPVILMPVAGIAAFRHRERRWNVDGQEIGQFQAFMPAVIANVLGLPAVAIPMGLSHGGLPIGVQLVGRPFEDELILEVAVRLEEARGPAPVPPVD
jgi:amidase